MAFNTKKMQRATGRASFTGAGQVMQETERSVPLEWLAGSMPFQGLRKPQALPGVLTSVSIKTLPPAVPGSLTFISET